MKYKKASKKDLLCLRLYNEMGIISSKLKFVASEAWSKLALESILRLFINKLSHDTKKEYGLRLNGGDYKILEKYKDCLGKDNWMDIYHVECFDDFIDAVRYCYLTDKQKKEWNIIKSAKEFMEGNNDKKTKS